jgi:uncharacterized protein YecE (DUF72 family)
VRVGTSSFSTDDWVGSFYPEGTAPGDYLARYAEKLGVVEIDATFYRIPSARQVAGWRQRTPDRFVFAAKVPQTVTHEDDFDKNVSELEAFVDVMRGLGPKLGPLLLQFPYISKARQPEEYATGDRFRERLAALAERLPRDLAFAVEVRNEKWIAPPLLDLLRGRGLALAFIDYYTTPGMSRIAMRPEAATAPFAYLRFLGNHRQMDAQVEAKAKGGGKRWDALVQDRGREMRAWVPVVRDLAGRMQEVFVWFNNHYAGHAPGSIELFRSVWLEG